LRTTTKKVISFWGKKDRVHPRRKSCSYAYGLQTKSDSDLLLYIGPHCDTVSHTICRQ